MSTLPPNKKNVNRTVINNDETLCTFSFVYNPDSTKQGMFAYPQEGDITPIKIQNMVIKSEGNYEYYDNDGNHDKTNPKNNFAKYVYDIQKTKCTDGGLTLEEQRMLPKGGSKRKSKSQRRRKSKSHRRKKSIKRRH